MKHCSMWWWILPLACGAPERLAGGDAKRTRQGRHRVDFGTLPQSKERARMANPVGDERCTLNTPETP